MMTEIACRRAFIRPRTRLPSLRPVRKTMTMAAACLLIAALLSWPPQQSAAAEQATATDVQDLIEALQRGSADSRQGARRPRTRCRGRSAGLDRGVGRSGVGRR